MMLRILWGCWLVFSILSFVLIKKGQSYVFTETVYSEPKDDYFFSLIIYDKRFWYLYIMNFFSIFYGYFIQNSFKVFGQKYIEDDHFISIVGAIAAIFDGLRFIWSVPMDYGYSYK